MLRSNLDIKIANNVRATESMTSDHLTSTRKEMATGDSFVSASTQNRMNAIVNVKPPKEVFVSAQWWDQRLVDALPIVPHLGKVSDLDEDSKEALRALALAAPHRDFES